MESTFSNDISAKMSQRLITIADMLKASDDIKAPEVVADVGCDHGYVSIYLIQQNIARSCLAMDVRKGPLEGAFNNIRDYGLEDRITTRLSDGLTALQKDEADALVIAGMGGKLMLRILNDGKVKELGIKQAVLQPQSDIQEFRAYLRNEGYVIADEKIVLDEGKYYFPMKVLIDPEAFSYSNRENVLHRVQKDLSDICHCEKEQSHRICNRFGEYNILRKDVLLKDFCQHGVEVCNTIMKSLDKAAHADRFMEVEAELSDLQIVLKYYEKG